MMAAEKTWRLGFLSPSSASIAIAVVLLGAGTVLRSDPPVEAPKQERPDSASLVKCYWDLVKRLDLYRFSNQPPPQNAPTVHEASYDRSKGTETICIGPPATKVVTLFLASTGRLIVIANLALWEHVYYSKPPLLPVKVPAGLTHEEAIAKARQWVQIVLGAFPEGLDPEPSVEYHETGGPETGDLRGKWLVGWRRVLNGYRYADDGVDVSFLEAYGFSQFDDNRLSGTCPTEVRITRESAMQLAHEAGRKALKKFASLYPTGEPGEAVKAELEIVHPNGLFDERVKTPWDLGTPPYGEVRLAWLIDFKGFTHPQEQDCQPEPVNTIQVWIDAGTGAAIGGAPWLHALRK